MLFVLLSAFAQVISKKEQREKNRIETRKKGKGYDIDATVSAYKLNLFVGTDGGASLTINSNERSSISYSGNIEKFEEPKGK